MSLDTALHRRRERSPALRGKLLQKREAGCSLKCDCCGSGPILAAPELRTAGFEAHHVRPLAESAEVSRTKVSDLALLCATCHRLIHHAMRLRARWVSVEELRGLLHPVAPTAEG